MSRTGRMTARWDVRALLVLSVVAAFAVLLAPARSAQPTPDARSSPPKAGDEIVMQRTERSKTFELPSGATVTRLYSQPVHYDAGSSGLQPIRNTLVPSPIAGYAVRNQANRFRADLPKQLSDPVRFREWRALGPVRPARISC